MPTLIGLTGYAGSGKDEAAKGLLRAGFTRVSFADGVRDLAVKIDPLVTMAGGYRLDGLVAEEGWHKAKQNPDVRRLLQNIGTGVRDVIGPDAWVDCAESKVWECGTDVVITDTRFPNEVEYIHANEGKIVRITRPGVGPVNNHISETAIDDIEADHTIINDGTPEELQAKLVAYAESLASVAS
jgi:hypothetical protein